MNQPPNLSAHDFWHSLVWNIEFDNVDFFPSLNWFLEATYTGSKNPVQIRKKKISSTNSKFQTRECQNSSVSGSNQGRGGGYAHHIGRHVPTWFEYVPTGLREKIVAKICYAITRLSPWQPPRPTKGSYGFRVLTIKLSVGQRFEATG